MRKVLWIAGQGSKGTVACKAPEPFTGKAGDKRSSKAYSGQIVPFEKPRNPSQAERHGKVRGGLLGTSKRSNGYVVSNWGGIRVR